MRTVKVAREQLIAKLEANCAAHRELYIEAEAGYRKKVIEELEKLLSAARDGGDIQTAVYLEQPQDHTQDYENALAMMNMSVDQVIELHEQEFKNYVLDQWAWSEGAISTNSLYAGKALPQRRRV